MSFEEQYVEEPNNKQQNDRYNLEKCVQNHYSEPEIWDEMIKLYRH